ncbi:MAG: sigma 54-interacting transcriptional regulator [Myxococcota bacterium]
MGNAFDEPARTIRKPLAAKARRAPRLLVSSATGTEAIDLPTDERVVVGRGDECLIRIDDPSVSREHLELTVGTSVEIRDLGSSNGSLLNDEALEPGQIRAFLPGDIVQVGDVLLSLQATAPSISPRMIWPYAFFEVRLGEEIARAEAERAGLTLIRVELTKRLEVGPVLRVLTPQLRSDELVGAYAPEQFHVLLRTDSPQRADEVQRVIAERATQAGVRAHTARAFYPQDGTSGQALIQMVSSRIRGSDQVDATGHALIVASSAMTKLFRMVDRVAQGGISVLIAGETGVGKEVVAESIHKRSPRSQGPFIRLNCAAMNENLLESELFGHEKGAFTGAVATKKGVFESAQGGTVFLDEIGDMPAGAQVKLLRVLESKTVTRVGTLNPISVDVRVVAATHRNLEEAIDNGDFRSDLYFRLSGIVLTVPPLRDRLEEIPKLAEVFVEHVSARDGWADRPQLSPEALKIFEGYAWPGNVRELRNVIERAVTLCETGVIEPDHLPLERLQTSFADAATPTPAPESKDDDVKTLAQDIEDLERRRIIEALQKYNGNQSEVSRKLGIPRRTLLTKLDAYRIPRPRKGR